MNKNLHYGGDYIQLFTGVFTDTGFLTATLAALFRFRQVMFNTNPR
jgi:hypothetical protein